MFHAVTWDAKAKPLPKKPPTLLSHGSEFGLVQRPGTARFHRAAARLSKAFQALRAEVPSRFRGEKGHVAPDLHAIFEQTLEDVRYAGSIKPMPLKLTGRQESTVKIFEEIWFNKQNELSVSEKVLTVLDMNWLQIGAHGMERLTDAVLASNCNKSLTSLMLSGNFIRDEGCKHLKRLLEHNSTITSLQLDHNDITEEGASFFGEALRSNRTLKTIELSRNALGHEGLKSILEGTKETGCLRALNLTDNGFLPESFLMLSQGLSRNDVPLLGLTICEGPNLVSQIQGDQLASLIGIALSRNTTLTSLNLPDNLIGDEGFGDVTDSLPHNSTLVHLNVRGNRITAWGAAKLGTALEHNSCLQSLDLSANEISAGSETNSLMHSMRSNTTLTDLDLSSNVCHFATEKPVRDIMDKNQSIYTQRNSDMHAFVSNMGATIQSKLGRLQAARDHSVEMIKKQQRAAALLAPFIHGTADAHAQDSDADEPEAPPNIFTDLPPPTPATRSGLNRLYQSKPPRVMLHINDPHRYGKGKVVTLPLGRSPDALWALLIDSATRLLPFRAWPPKVVFLDSAFKWTNDDGLQEVLPKGTEIFARHLPYVQDGLELVVSDGKGDGLGCIKKWYPRGSSSQRRHRLRVLYIRHQEHWTCEYWRIFVRFYRYRVALLERYKEASGHNPAHAHLRKSSQT